MPDILITGTDTGIGKTVIAAALVKEFRARGIRAVGFKPAETGINESDTADSEILQLAEPLAPAVAAERAGTSICPEEIEARVESLRRSGYTLVVEGAGGLMVPLAWKKGRGSFSERAGRKRPPSPFAARSDATVYTTPNSAR